MRWLAFALLLPVLCSQYGVAQAPNQPPVATQPAQDSPNGPGAGSGEINLVEMDSTRLVISVNKSQILRSDSPMRQVSVANPDLVEAVSITNRELVLNGKAPGETTLIVWNTTGQRTFNVVVLPLAAKMEAVRKQFTDELAGRDVNVTYEDGTVFLRGSVPDVVSADRALAIASTLGKVVNLLRVDVPQAETQILLKVRFLSIDRSASSQLGMNLFSTGATNTIGSVTTQQFSPPAATSSGTGGAPTSFTLSDALNIFLYRPDINLGATIQALETKSLAQILAEPNLLTRNGSAASFLAGGEFPFPTIQGGGALGQVTIQFREFGIRLRFLPTITPAGTIRLTVQPEVSALDFTNGLTIQGFTVPGLDVRRIQTEVELENGQSFAIAGLIDNQMTETINKVPGLGDIPVLGKFFQSRIKTKNNSELLVIVTPELVKPIPAGANGPVITMPKEFMKADPASATENPAPSQPITLNHPATLPVEQVKATQKSTPSLEPLSNAQQDMRPARTNSPDTPLQPLGQPQPNQ